MNYLKNLTLDRFLKGAGLLVIAILLYEPVYWVVLNLWCMVYGIIY